MSRRKSQRARAAAKLAARIALHASRDATPCTASDPACCPSATNDDPILLPPQLTEDPSGRPVTIRSGVDYAYRPVEWLWHKRIPIGKVTLLCGDPGLGKSLLALDVAARVTSGKPWPEQSSRHTPCAATEPVDNVDPTNSKLNPEPRTLNPPSPPGSVLVLTNEDNIADTVRPRFEAAGGDLRRIFFAESITNLREDFNQLVATLDRLPSCRLIIIDPVNSFVGPSDSHFATVVGRVLKPLAKLAEERGIAILAVTHLRKSDGATIQRAAGTMGFVGFARTVWTIARDRHDPHRRLLIPAKNNLAATDNALAYTIAGHERLDVPFVEWDPQLLDDDAVEVATTAKKRGPDAEERTAAAEWLKSVLADGPRCAFQVIEEAAEFGIAERTLRRALLQIGGKTLKNGFFGTWVWSADDNSPTDQAAAARERNWPGECATNDNPPGDNPSDADAAGNPPDTASPFPPPSAPSALTTDPVETWPLRENPEKSLRLDTPTMPPSKEPPPDSPPPAPPPDAETSGSTHRAVT